MTNELEIAQFSAGDLEGNLAGLTEILHASVMAGASINFISKSTIAIAHVQRL